MKRMGGCLLAATLLAVLVETPGRAGDPPKGFTSLWTLPSRLAAERRDPPFGSGLAIYLDRHINGFGVAQAMLQDDGKTGGTPAILVLTAYDQVAYIQAMLRLGVKGYWLKSARGSEIRQAVHEVARGKRSFAPEIRRLLLDEESNTPAIPAEPLTSRELDVLRLVVQGTRNSEIGQRLSIAVKTVETHLTSIYGKLGVQSRAEAIALAQKQGLLLGTLPESPVNRFEDLSLPGERPDGNA